MQCKTKHIFPNVLTGLFLATQLKGVAYSGLGTMGIVVLCL